MECLTPSDATGVLQPHLVGNVNVVVIRLRVRAAHTGNGMGTKQWLRDDMYTGFTSACEHTPVYRTKQGLTSSSASHVITWDIFVWFLSADLTLIVMLSDGDTARMDAVEGLERRLFHCVIITLLNCVAVNNLQPFYM